MFRVHHGSPLLLLFSDTKDRNSPYFLVASYNPQCRPDIYLRGGAEAGTIVIANAATEKHSCSTNSNRHTAVIIEALGIDKCPQAVLSPRCCHFCEFLLAFRFATKRVTLSDFGCEQGIEAIELKMRSIVCAQSEGCKALFRVPVGLALYVVINCGTK